MSPVFDPRTDAWLALRQLTLATMILDVDEPKWTILDANDAFERVTHRARAEIVGKGVLDVFPERVDGPGAAGTGEIARVFAEVKRGKTVLRPMRRYDINAFKGQHHAHEQFWEVVTAPVLNAEGEAVALIHQVVEITDRVRIGFERDRLEEVLQEQNRMLADQTRELTVTNQQLQESAVELEAQTLELQSLTTQLEERTEAVERELERSESILDTMTDRQFVLDHEFRFVSINAAMETALNVTQEELRGRTLWDVFPGTVGTFEKFYRDAAAGNPAHFTRDYADQERDLVVEVDAYPTSEKGVAVFWRDVTSRVRAERQLRESESELRTLVDAIPTLAWTARENGEIDWYNREWYTYTGTRREEMQGWGWAAVHDSDRVHEVIDGWNSRIEAREPFEVTLPLKGADGIFRQFLTRTVPIRNADGAIVRWFGTGTNVEEQHAARRSAEEANEAKTGFLATMSHELRTPLNAIGGYLDLLLMGLRGPLNAEQQSDLERIQRSYRHLTSLINDVLSFAKIGSGSTTYNITTVDVGDSLRRIEELISPQCAAKHISCELRAPNQGPMALADAERLGQILLNVLGNAVKFTPAGGHITATCFDANATVLVRIKDSGIGIAQHDLESIFDPFVQLGRRLNSPAEGVGLGLSISRTLAEGMDGTLSVESRLGEGCTFTLSLPKAALG